MFENGDRVTSSQEWVEHGMTKWSRVREDSVGTVVGQGREDGSVRVQWDHLVSPQRVSERFLAPAAPKAEPREPAGASWDDVELEAVPYRPWGEEQSPVVFTLERGDLIGLVIVMIVVAMIGWAACGVMGG